MKEKDKDKIDEQIARRRWLTGIRGYLIIVLIGLGFIGIYFHSHQFIQFSIAIGYLWCTTSVFLITFVLPNPDDPYHVDDLLKIIFFVGFCGGVFIFALVFRLLLRLAG